MDQKILRMLFKMLNWLEPAYTEATQTTQVQQFHFGNVRAVLTPSRPGTILGADFLRRSHNGVCSRGSVDRDSGRND
jgi:hypothetical protein